MAMANNKDKTETQNIQVYTRLRPYNKQEIECNAKSCLEVCGKDVLVHVPHGSKSYRFEKVFGMDSKQCDIYKTVMGPVIRDVMQGYNCTVFAYGQTGSGKTHTMVGGPASPKTTYTDDTQAGIVPRALDDLFQNHSQNADFTMRVSFLEVYNELLIDLLSLEDKVLKIYEDPRNKGSVQIHGLEEVTVYHRNQIYEILEKGNERRSTAPALVNAQLSRSHTIFSITVHSREMTVEGEELMKTGKLCLVDVAGSENISRASSGEKRVRETGSMNHSLYTFGRVIKSLVEKNGHVPYRESKLTRILQDSLGGKTKTFFIATASPASINSEETAAALDCAFKASSIINTPKLIKKMSKAALVHRYVEAIDSLKKDVLTARTRTGIYVDSENYHALIKEAEETKEELLKSVEECSKFDGRVKELERIRAELQEIHAVTKNELTEAMLSLSKTKENMEELRVERRVRQELIDKYDEAQTVLRQHSKALSDTLDKYVKEHQVLREKVTNLYSIVNTNDSESKKLINKYQLDQRDVSEQFNDLMISIKKQLNTIQIKMSKLEKTYGDMQDKYDCITQNVRDVTSKSIENINIAAEMNIAIVKNSNTSGDQLYEDLIKNIEDINKNTKSKVETNFLTLQKNLLEFCKEIENDSKKIQLQYTAVQEGINASVNFIREQMRNVLHTTKLQYEDYITQMMENRKSGQEIENSIQRFAQEVQSELQDISVQVNNKLQQFKSTYETKINSQCMSIDSHKSELTKSLKMQENIHKYLTGGFGSISSCCLNAEEFVTNNFERMDYDVRNFYSALENGVDSMVSTTHKINSDAGKYAEMCTKIDTLNNGVNKINETEINKIHVVLNKLQQDKEDLAKNNIQHSLELSEFVTATQESSTRLGSDCDELFGILKSNITESREAHASSNKETEILLHGFIDSLLTAKSKGDTPNGKISTIASKLPMKISKKLLVDMMHSNCASDDEQLDETIQISDSDGEIDEILIPE